MNIISFIQSLRATIRERPLYSLLAFTVFFVPLSFSPTGVELYDTIKFPLFCLCMGLVFCYVARERIFEARYYLSHLIIGFLFIGLAIISALVSADPLVGFLGAYPRLHSSVLLFGLWFAFVTILAAQLTMERIKSFVRVLVFAGAIVAFLAVLGSYGIGYYGGIEQLLAGKPPRISGLLGNPNFSSMFLVGILPFVVILAVESSKFYQRLLYGMLAFLYVWACIVFSSRGALLGVALGLGLVILYYIYQKNVKAVLWLGGIGALGALLFMGLFALYRPDVVNGTAAFVDENIATRFLAWNTSWHMIGTFPWLGTGPGQFQTNYIQFLTTPVTQFFDDPHNLLLNTLVTLGIPATLVFVLLFLQPILALLKKSRANVQPLTAAAVFSLAAFLLSTNFNPVPAGLWVLLGALLAIVLTPLATNVRHIVMSGKVRFGIAVFGGILIIYGLTFIAAEHLNVAAYTQLSQKHYPAAYRLARAAHILHPLHESSLVVAAAALARLPEGSAKAEAMVLKARDKHPASAPGYRFTANVYWILYEETQNEEFMRKSFSNLDHELVLNPYFASEYAYRAYLLLTAGKLEQAEASVKQSLVFDRKQFSGWMTLAKVYQQQGKRPQMLYALEQAYGLNSESKQLKQLIAQVKEVADIRTVQFNISVPVSLF